MKKYAKDTPEIHEVYNKLMNETFDINGKKIKIKFRNYIDPVFNDLWIPAKVVDEYKYCLLVDIEPHINPSQERPKKSHPYRVALNKINLIIGDVGMVVVDNNV